MLEKLQKLSRFIHCVSEWSGRLTSWLVVAMVCVIVYDVGMRYLFSEGSVMLQELQWHFFALIFLLGAAYTFKYDDHVRVDIFYQSKWVSDKGRAWVEVLGGIFILLPFCLLVISSSIPFISNSFQFLEGSPDPGGLPYRFLLKSAIPLGFFLLLLQGIAHSFDNVLIILGHHDKDAS